MTLTTRTHCATCQLRHLCMPTGLTAEQMTLIDQMMSARVKMARGQVLFRASGPFRSLFIVRTGFFKTTVASADGLSQVSGFYMGGELMGLDGIGAAQYACTAVALEDSAYSNEV